MLYVDYIAIFKKAAISCNEHQNKTTKKNTLLSVEWG